MKIVAKLINGGKKLPVYAKDLDCCADIFLKEDVELKFGTNKIGLGIAVHIPQGFEGNLRVRSSMANAGLLVANPSIDPGYTGEIHAVVYCFNPDGMKLSEGDRICSLIIQPFVRADFVDEVSNDRGNRGFGSTGQ